MTDFLERVSQMALGLKPTVRPLVVSRYAPGSPRPVPEMPTTEEGPLDSHASESLTGERRSQSLELESIALGESAEFSSQEISATKTDVKIERSASPPTAVFSESAVAVRAPFDAQAAQGPPPLNAQDLSAPEKRNAAGPTVEAENPAKPSVEEPEQSPSPTIYEESHALPETERRAPRKMYAKNATYRRPEAASSTANAYGEGETFQGGDESLPLTQENERSSQALPGTGSEPLDRSNSYTVSGSEPVERRQTSEGSMATASRVGDASDANRRVALAHENERGSEVTPRPRSEQVHHGESSAVHRNSSNLPGPQPIGPGESPPASSSEPINRRRASEDSPGLTSGSERDIKADRAEASSMPHRSDPGSFAQSTSVQSTSRRADSRTPSSQDERAANASHGQIIRVTIGRVEVRAAAAPPPPQPLEASAPPVPRLSLDEYLRQHKGRER